ncbi:nucleotidyltransferase [Halocella sp. SP3-1]|uniref:nucleotidyltransferase n=1 Tax=Halocella sp. SP3-1 TaxID=2382161 RepID=UPI000F7606C1|nr:nucleotidyltransferase [Halocella sp. SP3-1]AZO95329.1 nucleotidyltransferase [Halocella sp. SP3-1]
MNILGIITEYNPFHYGHLYHLKKAREITNSDGVICVMNGNFMQRGRPALLDKWARTHMAIKNGVDLIIELPLVYGIRSAEYFARGAVELLSNTNIVKNIVFGSESGNLKPLKEIASILLNEDEYFIERIKSYLTTGLSYPHAREKALIDFMKLKGSNNYQSNIKEITEIIMEPNNILGIEYIKAISQLNSSLTPLTIKRQGQNYHAKAINNKISSATAIRECFLNQGLSAITDYLPAESYQILEKWVKNQKIAMKNEYLGAIILATLRKLRPDDLIEFAEINTGLENRIYEAAHQAGDLEELIENIKTRSFTRTRIERNLLHILFDIRQRDFEFLDKKGPQYLRILGLNKQGEKILSKLTGKSSLPVIIKPARFLRSINTKSNDPLIKSLSYDLMASDIYSLLYPNKRERKGHRDFTTPLIKVK